MKKTLFISSFIAVSAITANAQVVDQQNLSTKPKLITLLDGDLNSSMTQSFKAGKTGKLTKIDFGLISGSGEEETVRVKLYEVSLETNNLSANAIAEDIVTVSANPSATSMAFAEFASAEISNGTIYSFVITLEGSPLAPLYVYGTNVQNYANGNLSYGDPIATDLEGDILFRTFVSEPTGVFSSTENASLKLYPNPCSTDAIKSDIELTNARLLDQSGNLIANYDSTQSIATQDLASGIYVLISDQGTQKVSIIK